MWITMCRASAPQVAFLESIIGFDVDNVPFSIFIGGPNHTPSIPPPPSSPGNNKQLLLHEKNENEGLPFFFWLLGQQLQNLFFFPSRG